MKPSEQIMPQARRRPRRQRSWRKNEKAAHRRSLSSERLAKTLKIGGAIAMMLIAPFLLGAIFRPLASSSMFRLKRVTIEGNNRYPVEQAEALARQVFGSNVMEGRLRAVRQRLMEEPLIKDAIVARVLPNMLRIRLIEREPVAVVALSSGRLVCVDAEGVVLGNFELLGDQPPLLGWDERASALSRSRNRRRIQLYLELKRALTATGRDDWNQVDQVDIGNLSDVAVSLTRSPMTWIHLGDGDFGSRFALGLDVLDAIRHRNREQLRRLGIPLNDEMLATGVNITYIDVSHPSRVVVRLPGAKLRSQIRRRKHQG